MSSTHGRIAQIISGGYLQGNSAVRDAAPCSAAAQHGITREHCHSRAPTSRPAIRAPVVPAGVAPREPSVIITSSAIKTCPSSHPHLVETARGKLTLDASVQAG